MSWIRGNHLWIRLGREKNIGTIFVVRRKLGNAVKRNRLKRRLRHIMYLDARDAAGSVVILAQPTAMTARFRDLQEELQELLSKL